MKRKDYICPEVLEVFEMPVGLNILVSQSGDADLWDYEDGGEMGDE